jgi:hypothetical protein
MKRIYAGLLSLVAAAQTGHARTDAVYLNNSAVTVPPQIDAKSFVNRGSFAFTNNLGVPFTTLNTESFVNAGQISIRPGFRFENASDSGVVVPSLWFSNAPNASIVAIEPPRTFGNSGASVLNPYRDTMPTYININADTVINRGLIQGTVGGEIGIHGNFVDLARSAVDITGFGTGANATSSTNGTVASDRGER